MNRLDDNEGVPYYRDYPCSAAEWPAITGRASLPVNLSLLYPSLI